MVEARPIEETTPLLHLTIQTDNFINSSNPISINTDYSTDIEAQDDDPLTNISHYYLVLEHENDIRYNVKKYVFLTVLSGTSVWLYGATGGLVAGSDLQLRICLITGSVVTNFCVTFNTSEALIDYIKSKQAPPELRKYISQAKSNKVEMLAIGSGAFLSAGPVTMAVFSNADKITVLLITEATITQIDNTFIHTLPMMLILQKPLLRALFSLPFLPLILGYRLFKRLTSTEEELHLKALSEIKAQKHAQIKKAMVDTLEAARAQIVDNSFQLNWNWRRFWNLKYNVKVPQNLQDLKQLNGMAALIKVVSYAPKIENLTSQSLCKKISNIILDSIIGNSIYLLGVGLANSGVLSFYKTAYDGVSFTDDSEAQWGLSAPANLLLIVLVGYFGGKFFRETLFDNLISCFKGEYQPPQAFKRYPQTTLLFIGLSIFFARYSYGTSLYLAQTHFNDPKFDSIRPFLYVCATYGLPIFTFKNTMEFVLNKTVEFARHFGENDNKASAVLDNKILELESFIQNMDDDLLEDSLKTRSLEERKNILRMSDEEFGQLISSSTEELQDETNITPSTSFIPVL